MKVIDPKLPAVVIAVAMLAIAMLTTAGAPPGQAADQLISFTAPMPNTESGPIWYYYGSEDLLLYSRGIDQGPIAGPARRRAASAAALCA
jgi:hypothetical protein